MDNATRIIGITGNIATGKSVVRTMLQNLGVLGMDADVIAHRVIYPGGGAYQGVVNAFGEAVLTEEGTISRPRVGEIVFQHPDKLKQLEAIVHPAVTRAAQARLAQTRPALAAVEAIKLLESDLAELCDAVWVSHAPQDVQLSRLMAARGLSEGNARARMAAQPPQADKINRADVIITTTGSFQDTWSQISLALNDTIQLAANRDAPDLHQQETLARLAQRWTAHVGGEGHSLYALLGRQMLLPMPADGLALWENRAFTACLAQVLPPTPGGLLEAFQAQAAQQACEVLLIPQALAAKHALRPEAAGYTLMRPADLGFPDWRQAAERAQADSQGSLWVKPLAQPVEATNRT